MTPLFDEGMTALKKRVLKMGSLVEAQIGNAIKSLVETDLSLAEQTIENDQRVNAMDLEIDGSCIRLLSHDKTAVKDRRFITTAMKISNDLKRISKLTEEICKRSIELSQEPLLKPYIDIPRMSEAAKKMTREALQAFVQRDRELAKRVCGDDGFINDLSNQIFRELVSYMIENSATITRAIRISFVSKYIERIGDHAANIAEMVVYLVDQESAGR